MKIQLVEQQDKKGCSAACIAMILGWPYEKVTEILFTDFSKTGLAHKVTREFITDHGFQAITKEVAAFHTTETSNREMLKPFAPIHLVEMKPWPDHGSWHAAVMDSKGKLYDPSGEPDKTVRKAHYISKVTGFWKIEAKL